MATEKPTARDVIVDALTARHEELSGEASPRDFDGASQILRALDAAGFVIMPTGGGEEFIERLKAAEDVCVMFAWTQARYVTDRDKAAHELWRRWTAASGNDCSKKRNPHLTDELIAELAAKRDATRAATLRHFFGPEVEG
jgi:uncharacterized protein YbaA (DUF1428 family)